MQHCCRLLEASDWLLVIYSEARNLDENANYPIPFLLVEGLAARGLSAILNNVFIEADDEADGVGV